MTRNEALYEIAELASTVVYQSTMDKDIHSNPPELFGWAQLLLNEAMASGVSGIPSKDFTRGKEWLKKVRVAYEASKLSPSNQS